jgi:hypothetical protein
MDPRCVRAMRRRAVPRLELRSGSGAGLHSQPTPGSRGDHRARRPLEPDSCVVRRAAGGSSPRFSARDRAVREVRSGFRRPGQRCSGGRSRFRARARRCADTGDLVPWWSAALPAVPVPGAPSGAGPCETPASGSGWQAALLRREVAGLRLRHRAARARDAGIGPGVASAGLPVGTTNVMPGAGRHHVFGVADYLAAARASPTKHEYADGQSYVVAGGTPRHNVLAQGVLESLARQLGAGPGFTMPADQRVSSLLLPPPPSSLRDSP